MKVTIEAQALPVEARLENQYGAARYFGDPVRVAPGDTAEVEVQPAQGLWLRELEIPLSVLSDGGEVL